MPHEAVRLAARALNQPGLSARGVQWRPEWPPLLSATHWTVVSQSGSRTAYIEVGNRTGKLILAERDAPRPFAAHSIAAAP